MRAFYRLENFRVNKMSNEHGPSRWPDGTPMSGTLNAQGEHEWSEEKDASGKVWFVRRPRFFGKRLRIRVASLADGNARIRQLDDLREKVQLGVLTQRQALVAVGALMRGRVLQVEDVWDPYFASLGERTKKIAACSWRYHLAPYFKGRRAAELTANVMAEWETKEKARPGKRDGELLSPKTIRNAYDLLRTAYTRAIEAGEIERLPWDPGYKPPSIAGHIERVATREACRSIEELQAIVREAILYDEKGQAGGRFSDLTARVFALAVCGLRQGEAAGLGWDDLELDVEPFTCKVRVQVTDGWRGRHPDWERPKSPPKSRRPQFLLHPAAVKMFRAHRDRLTERGWYRPDGPVFPTTGGGAVGGQWRSHADLVLPALFRRLVERAGLPNPERWVTHSLRHTYATLEAAKLPSIRDLQARTGHSSVQVLQGYMHSVGRGLVQSGIDLSVGDDFPEVEPRAIAGASLVGELALPDLGDVAAVTVQRGRAIEAERTEAKREKRRVEGKAFMDRHGLGQPFDYRSMLGNFGVESIRELLQGKLGPRLTYEKRKAYQRAYVAAVRVEGKEEAARRGRAAQALWLRHFYDALRRNAKARGCLPEGWTPPTHAPHGTKVDDDGRGE